MVATIVYEASPSPKSRRFHQSGSLLKALKIRSGAEVVNVEEERCRSEPPNMEVEVLNCMSHQSFSEPNYDDYNSPLRDILPKPKRARVQAPEHRDANDFVHFTLADLMSLSAEKPKPTDLKKALSQRHGRNWNEFGLQGFIVANAIASGFRTPRLVQCLAIPPILQGHDVIIQSERATGKMLSYTIAILHAVAQSTGEEFKGPKAIFVAPTGGLAAQLFMETTKLCLNLNINVMLVLDETSMAQNIETLRTQNVDAIIGSVDHIARLMCVSMAFRKYACGPAIKHVVVDDADYILNHMFLDPEILRLLANLNGCERQTILVTATMAKNPAMFEKLLRPGFITVHNSKFGGYGNAIHHDFIVVPGRHKGTEIIRQLRKLKEMKSVMPRVLIFTSRDIEADVLAAVLRSNAEFNAMSITGTRTAMEKLRLVKRFREEAGSVMLSSDNCIQDVDFGPLDYVISADLPPGDSVEELMRRHDHVGRYQLGHMLTFIDADCNGQEKNIYFQIIENRNNNQPGCKECEWFY